MGRAGRDGDPAEAVLFYRSQDLGLHKFFKGGGQVKVEEVQRILDALIAEGSIDYESLRAITKLSKIKLARALNRLEECGAVRLKPQGAIDLATNDPAALTGKAADAVQAQSERHQAELDRIEKIREYAENLNCRRAYLLRYFGEAAGLNCGNCDNCQGTGTERAQLIAETRARVGEAAVSTPGS
jgi:ATP-dependent DNA helicase RecQ